MIEPVLGFLKRLGASLGPAETLAAGVRLLRARRYELEAAALRTQAAAEKAAELETLTAEDREARVRSLARDRARAYPRSEDRFERMPKLAEPERAEACVRHLEDFSGAAGERLRDPGTAEIVRRLGTEGRLGPVLEDLLALPIGPEHAGDDDFAALERTVRDHLLGPAPESAAAAAWAALAGLAAGPVVAALETSSPEAAVVVEHDARINWAREANGIPLVHRVRVTNTSAAPIEGLVLRLQLGPELSVPLACALPPLAPGAEHEIRKPDIRLDGARLRGIRERERASLHVELRRGGAVLVCTTRPVDVLAYNEWDRTSLPELLAAFVLPNDPAVARVLGTARDLLRERTGDPALGGYQSKSRERVRAVVEAVYGAVQRLEVTYVNPPASFESTGQKLRVPAEVLEHRMGTCLDLTVLCAAAIEQCGLHPLLVTVKGHAFPGCWLLEDWLPVPATDDQHTLRKLAGAGEILLFDSSPAAARPEVPFADAVAAAERHLAADGALETLIDVRAARLARVLPLPLAAAGAAQAAGPSPAETSGEASAAAAAPEPVAPPAAPAPAPTHRRIEKWKEKLLDLTGHNRLLNFRPSREKSVAFAVPELDRLEDRLASGDGLWLEPEIVLDPADPRVAELLRSRGADELLKEQRLALLEKGRVLTRHPPEELAGRLTAIFRQARTELEETGSSTLYVAVGFLKWFEDDRTPIERRAPIVLQPVELVRPTARSLCRLRLRDDEPRINDTLIERLKRDFGLDFSELRQLPLDASGVDVQAVLGAFRRGVARVRRFEVLDETHLAFFSFAKFLMWRDLHEHGDDLMENALFQHLVKGEGAVDLDRSPFLDPRRLDEDRPPGEAKLVVDADSSQHVAVDAAVKGRTYILQGPPGTGKSQTITNIIAESLARGRRVLFVAEKRAALDVVAKRLRNAGLGDACLELHSNKANKREVIGELARVLEAAVPGAAADLPRLAGRVRDLTARLNAYAAALHAPAPLGLSHFEATARLLALRDAPPAALEFPDLLATTRETHEARLDRLLTLGSAAAPGSLGATPPGAHPFAACRVAEWTELKARSREAELKTLAAAAADLESAHAAAAALLGLPPDAAAHAPEALAAVLAVLGAGLPAGTAALAARPDAEAALARLDDAAARIRDRRARAAEFLPRFEERLLGLDLDTLLAAWRRNAGRFVVLRWLALRPHAAVLRGVGRGEMPSAARTLADLEAAVACRALDRDLAAEAAFLAEVLGAGARGAATDDIAILALTAAVRRRRAAAEDLARAAPGTHLAAPPDAEPAAARAARDRLAAAAAAWRAALDAVVLGLAVDAPAAFGAPKDRAAPRVTGERARGWLAALPRLRSWTRFAGAERPCLEAGLAPLCGALRDGAVAPEDLGRAYERAFLEAWVEHSIEAHPALAGFDGREQDRVVAEFRADDRSLIRAGGPAAAASAAGLRPAAGGHVVATSEVGILLREAKKKRAHPAVRRMLAQIPTLLPRLKPCLLMSPLSIAQYLPPGGDRFDLVIFDEASQIATHDAVGAVARGRQVIVVGDSKQLPPTTFFERQADEDEDDPEGPDEELVHELESILDECAASQVPSLMLRWHYRSRDERLIAFSNGRYYGNGLLTFPAAEAGAGHLGVSFVAVDGRFDRGKSRTNRAEAEAVAGWIAAALRDPARRERSIGVVTFNQPQQMLIEDLLDQERRRHPEIEPFFDARAAEPVFVKNLENVQGDERDVMLFSTTFGPDEQGRISMNFGALNKAGGERRLNVAITRARERLLVFASLRADAIDLSRTRATGVEHLKDFLRYAEVGPKALPADVAERGGPAESPLEADVAARLRAAGHRVDTRVGCSGYRVDLAIVDPANPGRHLLGIACDGASYHSGATARDRDRLRHSVLESLGWCVHRVWSLDWWRDPEGEVRRIEEALVAARAAAASRKGVPGSNAGVAAGPEAGPEPEPQASPVLAAPADMVNEAPAPLKTAALPEAAVPPEAEAVAAVEPAPPAAEPEPKTAPARASGLPAYDAYPVRRLGSRADFDDVRSDREILELLAAIVAHEGPVHEELVFRRVMHSFEIGQMGKLIRQRLESLLARVAGTGRVVVRGEFLWAPGSDPVAFDAIRGPDVLDVPRDIEHVPPEELAAAVRRILDGSIALPRPDLAKAVANLLGYGRATPRFHSALDAALALLAAAGGCLLDGDSVRRA